VSASVRERRSFRTKRAEKAGAVEGERRGFKTRAPIGFEGRVVPWHSQPCASRASWLPPPSCRAAQQPCAPTDKEIPTNTSKLSRSLATRFSVSACVVSLFQIAISLRRTSRHFDHETDHPNHDPRGTYDFMPSFPSRVPIQCSTEDRSTPKSVPSTATSGRRRAIAATFVQSRPRL